MSKTTKLFAALALGALLTGCAQAPVTAAFNFAKWDGSVGNPELVPTKVGEACAHSVLGLVGFGDASIETAKRNGQITKVATIDHRTTNVFYLYGGYCTVVYGN